MKTEAWRLAPGGLEFTLAAGRLAGLGPDSLAVEAGCGMGLTAVELVKHFGCRVEAFDLFPDFISRAKRLAAVQGLSDRINFCCADILRCLPAAEYCDFAAADGGVLTAAADREALLQLLSHALKPGGHLYLSDLAVHPWAPEPVSAYYRHLKTGSELLYRQLLPQLGLEIIFSCLLPDTAWRRYFCDINRAARRQAGFLKQPELAAKVREEAAVYYRQGGRGSVDYLLIVARKGCVGLKKG
ncbi:SAM-dependent methyltransferase [Candidatus Electronema sp. TJ]|uniref:SAM-dependent methyltransferase n=1 Tax=Candidatus Electronema sp. TJ TaxID=3401573 RepID=UPI003AA910AA